MERTMPPFTPPKALSMPGVLRIWRRLVPLLQRGRGRSRGPCFRPCTVQTSELVGTRHADHVAVIPELAVHGAGTQPELVDHVHPGVLDELMLVAKVERQLLARLVSEAHPQQSARAVWNARIAADDVGRRLVVADTGAQRPLVIQVIVATHAVHERVLVLLRQSD